MAIQKYSAIKDPNSIVEYGRNWGGTDGWLASNETITTSNWYITSDEEDIPTLAINITGSGISVDELSTSVWLEGGTDGVKYKLTNRITTSQGRTEDRTGIITVREK